MPPPPEHKLVAVRYLTNRYPMNNTEKGKENDNKTNNS